MRSIMFLALLLGIAYSYPTVAQSADTTITFKVKGITCGTDLKMIETSVTELEGVGEFIVAKQGATSTLSVSFDPALVDEKQIKAAIEGTASCEAPDERPYKVK